MNPYPDWLISEQRDGDEPRNWRACNRPLSPAELMYAYAIHLCEDLPTFETPDDGHGGWFGIDCRGPRI